MTKQLVKHYTVSEEGNIDFTVSIENDTQTTVELVEELLPQAVLDEQEADRKERTYGTKGVDFCDDGEPKEVEKEERLETLESRDQDDDVF